MNQLRRKYQNSNIEELKKENKSLKFHAKGMGETMVKLQNHIYTLREDMEKSYQHLQSG